MSPELALITAVLSGFATALVIEIIRYVIERKKVQDERDFERSQSLHAFMAYDDNTTESRPIARLLISTPSTMEKSKKFPRKGTREIFSVQDIKKPIVDNLVDEKSLWEKMFFWVKRKPKIGFEVYRTYYRQIKSEPGYVDCVDVWDTKDRVELLGRLTTIGRSRKNDIVLHPNLVSRLHAVIRFEMGNFVFYDLTITNPIKINDKEIEYRRILKDGDVIEFCGSYLIEFEQRDINEESSSPNQNSN